ncbi:hypothetical protein GPJ56_004475 [Histomonas meleagridis]|uniref:uncharacterized protein n=1 Tax=Histomonas meleagridis TaxID=135588 RepID=UPI00355A6565|nr:hypothetical protein GPJ56_004475 [Histomonas meleagridis]KAH0801997.1 hypothetical protein GO595_005078 [Histomonas meleagridis]
MFTILKSLNKTMKNQMGPVFCQLEAPMLCEGICQNMTFRELIPKESNPIKFITPPKYLTLEMPRDSEWGKLHQQYLSEFIGPLLLSSDDRIVQLAISILTNIGIQGGALADQIAMFIENAFKGFNIRSSSEYLVNFSFNFCFKRQHSSYESMYDSFIQIFHQLCDAINDTNQQQVKNLWFSDRNRNKFDKEVYKPLLRTCGMFSNSIESIISTLSDKEDCEFCLRLGKRILNELEKYNSKQSIYLRPFEALCSWAKMLCDENLMKAIYLSSSKEALIELLKFVENNYEVMYRVKNIVNNLVRKNKNYIDFEILNVLAKWKVEIAQNEIVRNLFTPMIKEFFMKMGPNSKEVNDVIPLMWKFANLQ